MVIASGSNTSDTSGLPIASSNASYEDDSNDNPATTSEGILNYINITIANVFIFLIKIVRYP